MMRERAHHGSYAHGHTRGAETVLHEVHEYEFRDSRHRKGEGRGTGGSVASLPPWGGTRWVDVAASDNRGGSSTQRARGQGSSWKVLPFREAGRGRASESRTR